MKEYIRPEMQIKSLVQDTAISADDNAYGDVVSVAVPDSWWTEQ